MKVRFCRHNQGAAEFFESFVAEQPLSEIKLKDCIKHCKSCKKTPVAKAGKQILTADSWDELKEMLINSRTM